MVTKEATMADQSGKLILESILKHPPDNTHQGHSRSAVFGGAGTVADPGELFPIASVSGPVVGKEEDILSLHHSSIIASPRQPGAHAAPGLPSNWLNYDEVLRSHHIAALYDNDSMGVLQNKLWDPHFMLYLAVPKPEHFVGYLNATINLLEQRHLDERTETYARILSDNVGKHYFHYFLQYLITFRCTNERSMHALLIEFLVGLEKNLDVSPTGHSCTVCKFDTDSSIKKGRKASAAVCTLRCVTDAIHSLLRFAPAIVNAPKYKVAAKNLGHFLGTYLSVRNKMGGSKFMEPQWLLRRLGIHKLVVQGMVMTFKTGKVGYLLTPVVICCAILDAMTAPFSAAVKDVLIYTLLWVYDYHGIQENEGPVKLQDSIFQQDGIADSVPLCPEFLAKYQSVGFEIVIAMKKCFPAKDMTEVRREVLTSGLSRGRPDLSSFVYETRQKIAEDQAMHEQDWKVYLKKCPIPEPASPAQRRTLRRQGLVAPPSWMISTQKQCAAEVVQSPVAAEYDESLFTVDPFDHSCKDRSIPLDLFPFTPHEDIFVVPHDVTLPSWIFVTPRQFLPAIDVMAPDFLSREATGKWDPENGILHAGCLHGNKAVDLVEGAHRSVPDRECLSTYRTPFLHDIKGGRPSLGLHMLDEWYERLETLRNCMLTNEKSGKGIFAHCAADYATALSHMDFFSFAQMERLIYWCIEAERPRLLAWFQLTFVCRFVVMMEIILMTLRWQCRVQWSVITCADIATSHPMVEELWRWSQSGHTITFQKLFLQSDLSALGWLPSDMRERLRSAFKPEKMGRVLITFKAPSLTPQVTQCWALSEVFPVDVFYLKKGKLMHYRNNYNLASLDTSGRWALKRNCAKMEPRPIAANELDNEVEKANVMPSYVRIGAEGFWTPTEGVATSSSLDATAAVIPTLPFFSICLDESPRGNSATKRVVNYRWLEFSMLPLGSAPPVEKDAQYHYIRICKALFDRERAIEVLWSWLPEQFAQRRQALLTTGGFFRYKKECELTKGSLQVLRSLTRNLVRLPASDLPYRDQPGRVLNQAFMKTFMDLATDSIFEFSLQQELIDLAVRHSFDRVLSHLKSGFWESLGKEDSMNERQPEELLWKEKLSSWSRESQLSFQFHHTLITTIQAFLFVYLEVRLKKYLLQVDESLLAASDEDHPHRSIRGPFAVIFLESLRYNIVRDENTLNGHERPSANDAILEIDEVFQRVVELNAEVITYFFTELLVQDALQRAYTCLLDRNLIRSTTSECSGLMPFELQSRVFHPMFADLQGCGASCKTESCSTWKYYDSLKEVIKRNECSNVRGSFGRLAFQGMPNRIGSFMAIWKTTRIQKSSIGVPLFTDFNDPQNVRLNGTDPDACIEGFRQHIRDYQDLLKLTGGPTLTRADFFSRANWKESDDSLSLLSLFLHVDCEAFQAIENAVVSNAAKEALAHTDAMKQKRKKGDRDFQRVPLPNGKAPIQNPIAEIRNITRHVNTIDAMCRYAALFDHKDLRNEHHLDPKRSCRDHLRCLDCSGIVTGGNSDRSTIYVNRIAKCSSKMTVFGSSPGQGVTTISKFNDHMDHVFAMLSIVERLSLIKQLMVRFDGYYKSHTLTTETLCYWYHLLEWLTAKMEFVGGDGAVKARESLQESCWQSFGLVVEEDEVAVRLQSLQTRTGSEVRGLIKRFQPSKRVSRLITPTAIDPNRNYDDSWVPFDILSLRSRLLIGDKGSEIWEDIDNALVNSLVWATTLMMDDGNNEADCSYSPGQLLWLHAIMLLSCLGNDINNLKIAWPLIQALVVDEAIDVYSTPINAALLGDALPFAKTIVTGEFDNTLKKITLCAIRQMLIVDDENYGYCKCEDMFQYDIPTLARLVISEENTSSRMTSDDKESPSAIILRGEEHVRGSEKEVVFFEMLSYLECYVTQFPEDMDCTGSRASTNEMIEGLHEFISFARVGGLTAQQYYRNGRHQKYNDISHWQGADESANSRCEACPPGNQLSRYRHPKHAALFMEAFSQDSCLRKLFREKEALAKFVDKEGVIDVASLWENGAQWIPIHVVCWYVLMLVNIEDIALWVIEDEMEQFLYEFAMILNGRKVSLYNECEEDTFITATLAGLGLLVSTNAWTIHTAAKIDMTMNSLCVISRIPIPRSYSESGRVILAAANRLLSVPNALIPGVVSRFLLSKTSTFLLRVTSRLRVCHQFTTLLVTNSLRMMSDIRRIDGNRLERDGTEGKSLGHMCDSIMKHVALVLWRVYNFSENARWRFNSTSSIDALDPDVLKYQFREADVLVTLCKHLESPSGKTQAIRLMKALSVLPRRDSNGLLNPKETESSTPEAIGIYDDYRLGRRHLSLASHATIFIHVQLYFLAYLAHIATPTDAVGREWLQITADRVLSWVVLGQVHKLNSGSKWCANKKRLSERHPALDVNVCAEDFQLDSPESIALRISLVHEVLIFICSCRYRIIGMSTWERNVRESAGAGAFLTKEVLCNTSKKLEPLVQPTILLSIRIAAEGIAEKSGPAHDFSRYYLALVLDMVEIRSGELPDEIFYLLVEIWDIDGAMKVEELSRFRSRIRNVPEPLYILQKTRQEEIRAAFELGGGKCDEYTRRKILNDFRLKEDPRLGVKLTGPGSSCCSQLSSMKKGNDQKENIRVWLFHARQLSENRAIMTARKKVATQSETVGDEIKASLMASLPEAQKMKADAEAAFEYSRTRDPLQKFLAENAQQEEPTNRWCPPVPQIIPYFQDMIDHPSVHVRQEQQHNAIMQGQQYRGPIPPLPFQPQGQGRSWDEYRRLPFEGMSQNDPRMAALNDPYFYVRQQQAAYLMVQQQRIMQQQQQQGTPLYLNQQGGHGLGNTEVPSIGGQPYWVQQGWPTPDEAQQKQAQHQHVMAMGGYGRYDYGWQSQGHGQTPMSPMLWNPKPQMNPFGYSQAQVRGRTPLDLSGSNWMASVQSPPQHNSMVNMYGVGSWHGGQGQEVSHQHGGHGSDYQQGSAGKNTNQKSSDTS